MGPQQEGPEARRAPGALLLGLGLVAFGLSALLGLQALGAVAHVSDEQAYLLQARIFAGGERVAPALQGQRSLLPYIFLWPEHYAAFPFGWPLVLALGVLLGQPALVNPLLGAALPALGWFAFAPRLGERVGRLCAGILALSPALLVLSGSLMSHTLTLAGALGVLALLHRPGLSPSLVGGGLWGLVLLTRPFDAVVVLAPLVALTLSRAPRRLLAFGLPALLALGLLLADNHARTGDAFTLPIEHYHAIPDESGESFPPGCNRLGFGPDRGCFGERGHDPARALRQLAAQGRIHDRLFLGFRGSLLLALLGLPLLARRDPRLLWPALATPLAYALYWYAGIVYGARFWTLTALGTVPAAALLLDALAGRLGRPALSWLPPLAGLSLILPLHAELADRYACVSAPRTRAIREAARAAGTVLLRTEGAPTGRWPLSIEGPRLCLPSLADAPLIAGNDPFQREGPVFLRLLGPEEEAVRAALADRPGPVLIVESELESDRFRVRAP